MKTIQGLILTMLVMGIGSAAFAGCWGSTGAAYVLYPMGSNCTTTVPTLTGGQTSDWGDMEVMSGVDQTLVSGSITPPGIMINSGSSSCAYATHACDASSHYLDSYQMPFQAVVQDNTGAGVDLLGIFYVGNSYIGSSPYYDFALTGTSQTVFDVVQPDDSTTDGNSPNISPCYDSNGNIYWAMCVNYI